MTLNPLGGRDEVPAQGPVATETAPGAPWRSVHAPLRQDDRRRARRRVSAPPRGRRQDGHTVPAVASSPPQTCRDRERRRAAPAAPRARATPPRVRPAAPPRAATEQEGRRPRQAPAAEGAPAAAARLPLALVGSGVKTHVHPPPGAAPPEGPVRLGTGVACGRPRHAGAAARGPAPRPRVARVGQRPVAHEVGGSPPAWAAAGAGTDAADAGVRWTVAPGPAAETAVVAAERPVPRRRPGARWAAAGDPGAAGDGSVFEPRPGRDGECEREREPPRGLRPPPSSPPTSDPAPAEDRTEEAPG